MDTPWFFRLTQDWPISSSHQTRQERDNLREDNQQCDSYDVHDDKPGHSFENVTQTDSVVDDGSQNEAVNAYRRGDQSYFEILDHDDAEPDQVVFQPVDNRDYNG